MDAVQGAGFEELNRSLAAYIQHLVLSRAQPQEAVPQVTSLRELAMLISEKPGMWARQWKRMGILEGRKEGREEGFQEGRQEGIAQGLRQEGELSGQAALLERLLTRKFGPLPDTLVQRIRTGSDSDLETFRRRRLHRTSVCFVISPDAGLPRCRMAYGRTISSACGHASS
ncbi:DUF4351 domain-containing protein [Parapusillimonas granuli]|uniref:DUF4351 domain-containing protein n=1 Tax=Parapusillimonas granuli TaxID=380911 RepID=A0A853G178_9BURK|nr:DUF4351 domain-containing protein [Parapusillimonas granuli]MBB5213737.1 hypothetical protein [Parapusillimonas granuli]NYT48571.1 DUF4351 domain-containing protein [Parapusillimonas granuli]